MCVFEYDLCPSKNMGRYMWLRDKRVNGGLLGRLEYEQVWSKRVTGMILLVQRGGRLEQGRGGEGEGKGGQDMVWEERLGYDDRDKTP